MLCPNSNHNLDCIRIHFPLLLFIVKIIVLNCCVVRWILLWYFPSCGIEHTIIDVSSPKRMNRLRSLRFVVVATVKVLCTPDCVLVGHLTLFSR